MDREVTDIPESKTIERKTFLKGAAATAAAVAGSSAVAGIARAASRVDVISSAPSGEATIWVNTNLFNAGQIAAFNKVYPNVKINQVTTLYVPNTPSLTAHLEAGVDVPDGVFFLEDAFLGQFAPVLYDVSKFLAPYESGIAPYKLAVSKQMGKTVGIPWDIDPSFLIYNMDIVDKAGVDINAIHTYDDLIEAAKTVQGKVPSCKTPLFFENQPPHVQFTVEGMAMQQHSGIVDAKGNLNLLTQPYTNAFNYLEKAGKAGLTCNAHFQTPALYSLWNSGQTCFHHFADWFSHWNAPGLKPLVGKIGLAKQPVFTPGKDTPYSIMGGSAYVVPLKAKNPELGALFGAFQLNDPAALKAGNVSVIYAANLPSSKALWPDVQLNAVRYKELLSPTIDEHSLLVTGSTNAPSTYRYPPWFSEAFTYYAPPTLKVIEGKMSGAQAQQQIYSDVLNKVIKRYHG
jgi:lactose/L-arabinose transport system substrate-binding protein